MSGYVPSHGRWSLIAVCVIAGACGSRTGLPGEGVQDSPDSGGHDDFRDPDDASSASDATAAADAARGADATRDARDGEPDLDALIPFDSGATILPSACPDGAATLVYLLGKDGALMSLYPPTLELQKIGAIHCPLPDGSSSSPNSMAVNHEGVAYVAYDDGQLFRVSLTNAACADIGFSTAPFQFGPRFGMAYAASATTAGETLYVAQNSTASSQLAAIDPVAKTLQVIGTISPPIPSPELTGDASGDLFAFYAVTGGGGAATSSAIARIDPVTAQRSAPASLPNVQQSGPNGGAWAFGFWGGDFYTFTDPDQTGSVVTRFRPSDGSVVRLTQLTNITVVGAGVSTCAPQ